MGLPMSVLPTMKQVNDWIVHILASDATIRQWCLDNYNRPHLIYSGVNDASPPTEAMCPYIAIIRDSHTGGFSPNAFGETFTFFLIANVTDDRELCDEDDGTNAEVRGVVALDNLADWVYLIRNALGETLPQPMTTQDYNVQMTDVASTALVSAVVTMTINVPRHTGGCFPIPPIPT